MCQRESEGVSGVGRSEGAAGSWIVRLIAVGPTLRSFCPPTRLDEGGRPLTLRHRPIASLLGNQSLPRDPYFA
uniref:Uncharacterized protein n=1 Tax=Steinernema glaseri TaxID=37863 RepID=A0A1I7ZTN5_9BILA